MSEDREARLPKIDEKVKAGSKRAIKRQLTDYKTGPKIPTTPSMGNQIPCSKCGATPSVAGEPPGLWFCSAHVKN